MLYLITGANGAGKTLNTLKWVRERSVKESRPVCHNGRFEPVEGGELSTWNKIDFKDWQDEPDGTIFLIDECHNDLPLRPPSAIPPEHVRMLAEHRRRGFDFYLVTQHPQNIDSFVRRLIGSPGWHRHLKRTFGGDLVSCIEWASVNPACEKTGSGKNGDVTMVAFPKEVFTWYKSASLHTGKKKIPKSVWFLLVAVVLIPLMLYFAVTGVYGNVTKHSKPVDSAAVIASPAAGAGAQYATGRAASAVKTTGEYLDERKPRIPDFPHTAAVYDQTTQPVQAPYPAACVAMAKTCKCYSQQATLLQVSADVCAQIVAQGFFMDWQQPRQDAPLRVDRPMVQSQQVQPVRVSQPQAQPIQQDQAPSEWSQALATRNAQVRSQFGR